MSAASPSSPSVEASLKESRTLLMVSATISMTAMGITLMACAVAAHCLAHADDLPYRLAAGVFVKLALGASAIGFAGLCGFVGALRPIFRRLVLAAQKARANEEDAKL